jgi:hypothetical protein
MKQRTSSEGLLADRLTRLRRPLPPDLIGRAIAEAGIEDAAAQPATLVHGIGAVPRGGGRAIATLASATPHRRRPNFLRLALTAVTAGAVAAGTFAAIVVTSGHSGRSGVTQVSGTPTATPTPAPYVAISTVSTVGVAPICTKLPLGEDGSTGTQFGFLDTETGAFTADPTASAGSLKPGGPSYLSSMGGWWSPTLGAVNDNNMIAMAPDGSSYAYLVAAAGAIDDGTVHIATPTSNRTLTPPGELDILVGWSDEGIVVQRVNVTEERITGTWVVDPTTGQEREITLPSGGPESPPGNVVAEGDAVWEVIGGAASATGATIPDSLVRYDLQTGVTTTWFDLEGYYEWGGLLPAGDLAPNKTGHTTPYIEVLGFDSQGDPVLGVGPLSEQGGVAPTGELLLATGPEAVTVIRAAGQPGADANYVQPDGNGIWFSGTDSAPQLVYHWDPSTGWHAVTSLPSQVNVARVVGPCA